MTGGLAALLAELIDYAGLFPPASLGMGATFANYGAYRSGGDAWMLGALICPASRLGELSPLIAGRLSPDDPINLSILGGNSSTADEFVASMFTDLDHIGAFLRDFEGQVRVGAFEGKMPATIVSQKNSRALADLLHSAMDGLEDRCPKGVVPYWEASPKSNWCAVMSAALEAVALANHQRPADQPEAGFKLRCGGTEPAAFPTTAEVAHVLYEACRLGVPLKFTAGLHHPVRHFHQALGCKMHGFLNMFVAGILAQMHDLDPGTIQQILEEEDGAAFRFDNDGMSWKQLVAPAQDIANVRRERVRSFGSCSFDEPREDLRSMGLM